MNQPYKSDDLLDHLLDIPSKHQTTFNSSYLLNSSVIGDNQSQKYLLKESNSGFKYDVNQSYGYDDSMKKKEIGGVSFDDAPIGKSNFMISEQIGNQNEEENIEKLTLEQKILAKSVKTRMAGFDQLLGVINMRNKYEFDGIIDKISFSKLLKQSNPGCFQKILSCYKQSVFSSWITSTSEQLKQIIENAFTSSKPIIKKMSIDLIQLNFQSSPSIFQSLILDGFKTKNAKSIVGYLSLLSELLATYGIKKLNYLKIYYGQIVNLLNNQKNANVKTEAMNLLKQAVKWVGLELVLQYATALKQPLKKQLQRMWEQYDKTPMIPKKGGIQVIAQTSSYIREPVNIYDIADEVDVLKRFTEKWADQVLNTAKWSDKTALLQQMIDACNVAKIAPGESRHIIDMCKRLLTDSNQNVVIYTLRLLGALAKGLRRNIYSPLKSLFLSILLKFRQKKTQLIEQVTKCLDLFLLSFELSQVHDDIKEGTNDKNPHMRYQALEWLNKNITKFIQEKDKGFLDKQKEGFRAIELLAEKLNSDGASEVRDAARKLLQSIAVLLDKDVNIFQSKVTESKSHSRQPSKQKRKSIEKVSKSKHNTSIISNSSIHKSKHQASQNSILMNNTSGYRADISNELTRLTPKLNDSDWQKRKSALDELQELLDQYPTIHTNGIYDLLSILKTRIFDANKQLARQTIHIVGKLIESAGKQAKVHARAIVNSLVDVLAQKNESIRKESINSLSQIGKIVGTQVILHPMAQCLDNEKVQLKTEILKFLLSNDDHLLNIKQFTKGIISCLCDKNREIRSLAEKIFEKTWESVGMNHYKTLAKQKPAFIKDLNDIFAKFEKGNGSRNGSSESKLLSRVASPRNNISHQTKHFPPSNKKPAPSLNKTLGTIPRYPSTSEISVSQIRQQYDGQQVFAPLKTLTANRMQRSEQQQNKIFNYFFRCQINSLDLIQTLKSNIRRDIVQKMTSMDYQKVIEISSTLSRMCKDLVSQASLRQVYDIIFKWVFIKLWGGNPSMSSLFDLVSQILAILQKKNILIKQYQVQLILSIIRQYFLSIQHYSKDNINLVLRCLIKVNSASTVLKTLLKHFNLDVNSIHHHLKKQTTYKYKQFLTWMVKNNFMEYLESQQIMIEIVKIKELARDEEFLNKLYSMFNQNWLNQYGFRKINSEQPSIVSTRSVQSVQFKEQVVQDKKKSLSRNESRGMLNKVTNHNSPRSKSKTPRGVSQYKGFGMESKKAETPKAKIPTVKVIPPPAKKQQRYELPLYAYAWPTQMNPIYQHLNNLCPASESTCSYFQTLFTHSSEKLSNQLQTYAKVIMGSLFKGLVWAFEHRDQIHPEKIIHQAVLLQQAAKNKSIIKNCQDVLYTIFDYLSNQLVLQDQNKFMIAQKLRERNIQFSIEKFGKTLNVCMLRILDFAQPNFLIVVLFQLLTKCIKNRFTSSPRLVSLLLKCVFKMKNNYISTIKQNMVPQLFKEFYNYHVAISDIEIEDDEGSARIKQLIAEIANKLKENVWICYEKANLMKDDFIIKYLRTLNVPRERIKSDQKEDQLKSITEMLSKSRTYESGISMLSGFLDKNPEFQITQYYLQQQYDHKFIARVLASLQTRQKRPTAIRQQLQPRHIPTTSSPSSSILNQVRSLKQHHQNSQSRVERSNFGRSKDKYSPRDFARNNVSQLQKKITTMGTKMGNAIK